MHEYRDSQICKEMRAILPNVSDVDQHFGSLVAGVLPQQGNMQRILVVGAHDTLIPAVLGGLKYNYDVFALVTHVAYMERQWHYLQKARVRYDGRCLAKPMQSPYRAMADFGEYRFPYIIVMPGTEFSLVHDYCVNYLHDDGTMVVAQRHPWMIDDAGLRLVWKRFLRATDAGYCIETEDEERAEWIVVALKKDREA